MSMSSRMEDVCIPTINIGPFLTPSSSAFRILSEEDRAATSGRLLRACESHGLFFVTGHGITADGRRQAFDDARRFFSLPEATKQKIPAKKGGFTRGYIGFGGESGSNLLECKEAFSYGYPWPEDEPPENVLQGANIWPDSDDLGTAWREKMIVLFRLMVGVNEAVSRGLSQSLDLDLEDLPTLCRGGDTISLMRAFHYFPYSNDHDGKHVREVSHQNKIGSSPHTDWGLSTSILQDGAGGLQFLQHDTQRWIDVPCAEEDALVFNCGDYLSLLSNGRLKSPVHQVVTTGVERTSFVFFYYPSFDAKLPVAVSPAFGGEAEAASAAAGSAGSSTAASDTTTASAAGSSPATKERHAGQVGYNTLLKLQGEDATSREGVSFGQYLARKWGDVFRG